MVDRTSFANAGRLRIGTEAILSSAILALRCLHGPCQNTDNSARTHRPSGLAYRAVRP